MPVRLVVVLHIWELFLAHQPNTRRGGGQCEQCHHLNQSCLHVHNRPPDEAPPPGQLADESSACLLARYYEVVTCQAMGKAVYPEAHGRLR